MALRICLTGFPSEEKRDVTQRLMKAGIDYSPHLDDSVTHLVARAPNSEKIRAVLSIRALGEHVQIVSPFWLAKILSSSTAKSWQEDDRVYGPPDAQVHSQNNPNEEDSADADNNVLDRCSEEATQAATEADTLPEKCSGGEDSELSRQTPSVFSESKFIIDESVSETESQSVRDKIQLLQGQVLPYSQKSLKDVSGKYTFVVLSNTRRIGSYPKPVLNFVSPPWVIHACESSVLPRLIKISHDLASDSSMESLSCSERAHKSSNDSELQPSTEDGNDHGTGSRKRKCPWRSAAEAELALHQVRERKKSQGRRWNKVTGPYELLTNLSWRVVDSPESAAIDGDQEQLEDRTTANWVETYGNETVIKSDFLTVLYPIDRFQESGAQSRTYTSNGGFTALEILQSIHDYYQEEVPEDEERILLRTTSKYGERLRQVYKASGGVVSTRRTANRAKTEDDPDRTFKREAFIGSLSCFKGLRRLSAEGNGPVYFLALDVS